VYGCANSKYLFIRRISNANAVKSQGVSNIQTRFVDSNQIGFLCPFESPDGKHAGIQKNLSIGCEVSYEH
jgi:DNA-directed RNA polymerase beta subunit